MARCRPVDASQLTLEGEGLRSLSLADAAAFWGRAPAEIGGREVLNHVYVHVPFCKSICSFCNYERLRPSSSAELRGWLERLIADLDALASSLGHLRFHTLYFGGGTPSVLPAAMIRRAIEAIHGVLRFHPRAHRAFELDPAVMSREKLEVLKQLGFRSFSFGIQTLDPAVNEAHQRGRQGRDVVARRFADFAEAGLSRVSCDFLLGLAGTDPEGSFRELGEALARWRPQRVDVFLIAPTERYIRLHFGGEAEAFWEHLTPFQRAAPRRLAALARRHRYTLKPGGGHRFALTRRPGPAEVLRMGRGALAQLREPFVYHQTVAEQGRPMSLLGLGPSARSSVYGLTRLTRCGAGDPGDFIGREVDLRAESASYLLYTLRDADAVSLRDFRRLFGAAPAALHGEAVAAWRALGLLRPDRRALRLKPQEPRARLEALLWLVPAEDLEAALRRQGGRGPRAARRPTSPSTP